MRHLPRFIVTLLGAGILSLCARPAIAQTEAVYDITTDALGSIRMITDANQQVVERHDFLPFGEEWGTPSAMSAVKFTGKERDAETSFSYFGARYLSSAQGRFTSVDPAFESAILEAPQTWNRYSYVYNRPTFATDPDGRCPPCAGAIVGGIIGGVGEGLWNVGSQYFEHGHSFQGFQWGQWRASVAGGAVAGAIAGATGGESLLAEAAWGAASSVTGNTVTRTMEGKETTAGDVVADAVGGFAGGAAGHVAGKLVKVPDEPALPGTRRHAVGRRKLAAYDKAVAGRNTSGLVRTGVGGALGVPPSHVVGDNFWNAIDWLMLPPPPPLPPPVVTTPVVTTVTCFQNVNFGLVCE